MISEEVVLAQILSRAMAPEPLSADGIARAVSSLPTALFVGDVSGPLNAEATTLSQQLDPKLNEIRAEIAATLELCHAGNEPSAGALKEDVEALRLGGEFIAISSKVSTIRGIVLPGMVCYRRVRCCTTDKASLHPTP